MSCRVYSPCLLVAEFLGDDFAQVQSEAIRHSLGQVVVRAPAKKHDVGHIRDGGKIGLLWRRRRERERVGGDAKEKKGRRRRRRRRRRDRSPPAVWRKKMGGKFGELVLQAEHCTGAAVWTSREEERYHVPPG